MPEVARTAPPTPATTRRRRARAARVLSVALVVLVAGLGAPTAGAAAETPHGRVFAPGLQLLAASPSATVLPSTASALALSGAAGTTGTFTPPANTDFALDFDGSVDASTRQVVTAAAGVWSAVLDTRVPIVVDVRMQAMAPGMLGAAGPTTGHFGRPSFPQPDVLYPVALANQFAGRDLDVGLPDIELVLSSSMSWDKRIDGDVSPTGQSMLSVAIHELGHGLGHTSWIRRTATGWVVNYVVDGTTVALAYDRLAATTGGTPITSVREADLAQALVSSLQWSGQRGRTAAGGPAPKLYSPPVVELGSSVGHLDEATFGSGIMTPFLARGEAHTTVPALTRAMLADTGWAISGSTSGTTTPTTTESTTSTTQPTAGPSTPSTVEGRAEAFVDAVVQDFLGRAATDQERTHWRDRLLAGTPRGEVTRAFAYSDEWVGVIVDDLYWSTLGRGPDAGGRSHWIDLIRSGVTPAEVASYFYASDEYFRRSGGTATAWIRDLYTEILGRQPDAAGLVFWLGRTATMSRTAIAHDLYQSLESRRDRVSALFERLLGRAPDGDGWAYWAAILSNGRDVDLAVFLAASDEYYGRTGSTTS